MGKKRRKRKKNYNQRYSNALTSKERKKLKKSSKQRSNPLFFCEKQNFEIDSMIAKGTMILLANTNAQVKI